MSTYDGMILREREYIHNRANQRGSEAEAEAAAAAAGGTPYDEAFDEEQGSESQQPGDQNPPPPAGSEEGAESNAGGGNLPPGGGNQREGDFDGSGSKDRGFPPPPDIPDGSDDDLVARQMREAAEKETDPELKKKLWEEYRKYKQGSR